MRLSYPRCLIKTDSSESSKEVIKSLRYSTHCEFYVDDLHSVEVNDFPHFHSFDLNETNEEYSFNIDCSDGKFLFSLSSAKSNFPAELSKLITSPISLFEAEIANITSFDKSISWAEFTFLIDFSGHCKPIAAILRGSGYTCFTSGELENNLSTFCNSLSELPFKNYVFSISVDINNKVNEISVHIGKHRKSWEILRAFGINIPLIAVQNLLGRKILTFRFVSHRAIRISSDGRPVYCFNPLKYYFDLDETLICRGKPVAKVITYLFNLHSQGKELVLLTRHSGCIESTLKSIGIKQNVFSKIIKVEMHQKKSAFISKNEDAVFIDNEFPERYDVRMNCVIDVLDLDQVDFTAFG